MMNINVTSMLHHYYLAGRSTHLPNFLAKCFVQSRNCGYSCYGIGCTTFLGLQQTNLTLANSKIIKYSLYYDTKRHKRCKMSTSHTIN